MFRKIIITFVSVFLFCLLLVGCQNKKVSDEKIIQDIPEEFRTLNFYESTHVLDVESIQIEKRNTTESGDTVYFTAEMNDDYYHVTKQFTFYYDKYTEGGLILNSVDVRGTSISTDEENLPVELIDTISYSMGIGYGDDNYEQTNIESYVSEKNYPQYLISYNINRQTQYLHKTGEIKVLLTLDYYEGSYYWEFEEYETSNLELCVTDKVIGEYELEYQGDPVTLTIDAYDKETKAIHIAKAQCVSRSRFLDDTYTEISDVTIVPSVIDIEDDSVEYVIDGFACRGGNVPSIEFTEKFVDLIHS